MFGLKLLDSNWIVKSRSGKHTRQRWMEDIRITNSEHPKRIRETSFWMNPCWIFFWFTHYFVIKAMNHVTFQAVKNRRFFKPLLCLGVQLLGTHRPGRSRRSKLRVHVAKWCKIQSVIICIHRWCVSRCVCSNKKNSDTDRVNIDLHAGTPHLHMKPHQWPAHMESTKRTVVPRIP